MKSRNQSKRRPFSFESLEKRELMAATAIGPVLIDTVLRPAETVTSNYEIAPNGSSQVLSTAESQESLELLHTIFARETKPISLDYFAVNKHDTQVLNVRKGDRLRFDLSFSGPQYFDGPSQPNGITDSPVTFGFATTSMAGGQEFDDINLRDLEGSIPLVGHYRRSFSFDLIAQASKEEICWHLEGWMGRAYRPTVAGILKIYKVTEVQPEITTNVIAIPPIFQKHSILVRAENDSNAPPGHKSSPTDYGLYYAISEGGKTKYQKIASKEISTATPGAASFTIHPNSMPTVPRNTIGLVTRVDASEEVSETNEKDNVSAVTRIPNLVAGELQISQLEKKGDYAGEFTYYVEGASPQIVGRVYAQIWFADEHNEPRKEVARQQIDFSKDGEQVLSVTPDKFQDIPEGATKLIARLDATNRIFESRSFDNISESLLPNRLTKGHVRIEETHWIEKGKDSDGVRVKYSLRQGNLPDRAKPTLRLYWSDYSKTIHNGATLAASKTLSWNKIEGKIDFNPGELGPSWNGERFLIAQIELPSNVDKEDYEANKRQVDGADLPPKVSDQVSWELLRSGPSGPAPAKIRVARWLSDHATLIKTLASRNQYRIAPEAIAGAIAYQALNNVNNFSTTPGKVDFYSFDTYAVELTDEYRGRIPQSMTPEDRRTAMLSGNDSKAVEYIAAIMNAYSAEAKRAGFRIRKDVGTLISLYENSLKNSPKIQNPQLFTGAPRKLELESAIATWEEGGILRSGFLISSRHVLTSEANIIDLKSTGIQIGGITVPIESVRSLDRRDLGIITLSQAISDIRPIEIASQKSINHVSAGDTATWLISHPEGDLGSIGVASGENFITDANRQSRSWKWLRETSGIPSITGITDGKNVYEPQGEAGNPGGPVLVKTRNSFEAIGVNQADKSRISGIARRQKTIRSEEYIPVTLQRVDADGRLTSAIQSEVETWVIAHGRTDSAESFYSLARSIARASGDQVLVLDWSAGAADNSLVGAKLDGSKWIKPTAKWAADVLKEQFKISGNNLRLVGHSWGSFVAHEIAELQSSVGALVALDPAAEAYGGYDDESVNFSSKTQNSWAIYGDGVYGSVSRAQTAQNTFTIKYNPSLIDDVLGDRSSEKHLAPVKLFHR